MRVAMATQFLQKRDNRNMSFLPLVIKLISIMISLSVILHNVNGQVEEVAVRRGLYSNTNSARWPKALTASTADSLVQCATGCHDNKLFAAVNFQASTKICEQVGYPLDSAPVSSDGWRSAVLDVPEMIQTDMTGAVARQYSTRRSDGPENGIDGDTNGVLSAGSCFHTADQYSWWLVELQHNTELAGVTIYIRTDCCCGLRFLVSSSCQDSDAGIGTDVGFYEGPPTVADNPLQIVFRGSIFGKVFKIQHELDKPLHLCEIILKSPSY